MHHRAPTASAIVFGVSAALFAAATPASADVLVALRAQGLDPARVCVHAKGTGVLDPGSFFDQLVARYRSLVVYEDSVTLEHRTFDAFDPSATKVVPLSEQAMDCVVEGDVLAVRSSSVFGGGSQRASDESPLAKFALAERLWTLPHLALRLADEPLRSMQGGRGALVPVRLERVVIDDRSFMRLHLESSPVADAGGAPGVAGGDSTVDLFVNPESMLVERVEHARTIAEGFRYEATLTIVPERAVPAPVVAPVSGAATSTEPSLGDPTRSPPAAPEVDPPAPPQQQQDQQQQHQQHQQHQQQHGTNSPDVQRAGAPTLGL